MNLAFDSLAPGYIRSRRDAKSARRRLCRLLYLTGGLHTGGSERQLYCLLRSIDRERYQPEVVVWSYREEDAYVSYIRKLGIPIHFFSPGLSGYQKLFGFRRLLVELRPQVIHSYTFYTNFAACWATLGTPTVAIGAMRSDFDYDRNSSGIVLGGLSLRWPRTQIYNNTAAADQARLDGRWFLPRRIFVVRNGIDLEEFGPAPLSMNGQVRILGVGSLLQVKRWDRLLMAASNLKERGFEFQVEICGDGPLREALQQRARTLGLRERVHFMGESNDIARSFARSSFLAHAADSEGCPNVIMEAMACGRAVVAMDAGDISFLVEDGNTGFVVRRGDEAAFADRMARLITDRTLCLRMGEAGRAKAEREFGGSRLADETLAVYRAAGWTDS
jgi:glycosyltransferase involved in cell wall biosynthesis